MWEGGHRSAMLTDILLCTILYTIITNSAARGLANYLLYESGRSVHSLFEFMSIPMWLTVFLRV